MDHLEAIQKGLDDNLKHSEIIRKVYLTYPTRAFVGNEEDQFEILNSISKFFSVPIMAVQVAGSAKIGHSLHKKKEFSPATSDLDIAIIDTMLYLKYVELVFDLTKSYSNRTGFSSNPAVGCETYLKYLTKGIFRIDLMPSCSERAEVNKYFGELSQKHRKLFKKINASIYMSQSFFENKQRSVIRNYQGYKV